MTSAICTLFEGHYHHGLAALVNSAFANEFSGDIYAGYRGELPSWAEKAVNLPELNWENSKTIEFRSDFRLHFLPLKTSYHLTNYKPDFMLELWNGVAEDCDILYYLDPDIVICKSWAMMEDWANSGVALCEDINSPLPKNHPRRTAWRKYYKTFGFSLSFKDPIYVNGGCTGLKKKDIGFLHLWQKLQENMADAIGGLEYAGITTFYTGKRMEANKKGDFAPFSKTDQDALNATIEAWDGEVSLVGMEAMGFKNTNPIFAHALGTPKPWMKAYIRFALKGRYPTNADKFYWNYTHEPIALFSRQKIRRTKKQLLIGSAIGKFYKNS